ncbi:hypothetical protein HO133_003809 [Letharia lupina]|uniref:Uncharacterized protein n=1 Tax=Letharia lupina TaxID=560253 RepID=A0A8H6CB09_9LECA|nr:uncharacterized protein HO133_003809 [Letharia lupina]KAF6219984.1 hypothetical protein HO133_003809 [Letharia lupina]
MSHVLMRTEKETGLLLPTDNLRNILKTCVSLELPPQSPEDPTPTAKATQTSSARLSLKYGTASPPTWSI